MILKLLFIMPIIFLPLEDLFASKLDKESLCQMQPNGLPESGPQIAVIYDLSEPFPKEVIGNLFTKMQSVLSKVEPQTRMTLFVFDRSKAFHTSIPVDSFCLAGHYSSFALFAPNENTLKPRRKKELKRLEDFLQGNNPRQATQGSPIIDALVSAVTSQNVITVLKDNYKIFLISDLIEYSSRADFYGKPLDHLNAKSIAAEVSGDIPELGMVSNITFLYVKREKYQKLQNKALELFWSELMTSRRVQSISFVPIQ